MKFFKVFGFVTILLLTNIVFAKKIIFFRKDSKDAIMVVEELEKELKKIKYEIEVEEYDKDDEYSDFKEEVDDYKPNLIVVLDNLAVNWVKKYNQESKKKIPSIALMGLNLKTDLKGNKHIAGIAYETPAYSLATKFSNAIEEKIKEVVVFYRKKVFQERINEATDQLKIAQMKLKAINIEDNVEGLLKKHLDKMLKEKKKGRAIWVMLDSAILSGKVLKNVWLPFAKKNAIPLIAETQRLAKKDLDFCVFATTPNLTQLANQASQMVRFILENGVKPHEIGIENLIAVDAYMNQTKADMLKLKIKEEAQYSINILK